MIVLSSASIPLERLWGASPAPLNFPNFSRGASQYTDWQITDWNTSPSALLFLAWHEVPEQQLIIKMLREYQDTRYSLETLEKRQQCLQEALQRNRIFTPALYIGLAPLCHLDLQQKTISIGEVIENSANRPLVADTEYVLLMKPQDQDTRLDYLLEQGKIASLYPLAEYVAEIHTTKVFPVSPEESIRWASYEKLMYKLDHNLELLDFLIARCNESDWADRRELAERVGEVKKKAQEFARQDCYHEYFKQRFNNGSIKLCHGDIKSPHIWVASDGSNGEQDWAFNILDAIDFNQAYNHIDILSDFAMLIADVQSRTQSPEIMNKMIDCYLHRTKQDCKEARKVLDFYIIEKAIVGTGISILYDEKPDLGRAFLEVAENRLGIKLAVGAAV
jgi:aminoglycoside phosphotransferase family enzyme